MATKSAGTPAITTLDSAGMTYTQHSYEHDPRADSYGLEAAAALGIDPERVFKTLLVTTGTGLGVGVVSVATELDLKSMAAALGTKRVAMADVADAERATGYVAGGISPLGQRKRLPTVVDVSAESFPTVFVSAGRRGLEVELAPADLVALTGATIHRISRDRTNRE